MTGKLIRVAKSAYQYPLLVRHLCIHRSRMRPIRRSSTATRRASPTARCASASAASRGARTIGVGPGYTVAVMDWDSHRYLEAFFAIPMMGAVLQTVNVRLSPEEITYTINHAGASALLPHELSPVARRHEVDPESEDPHPDDRQARAAAGSLRSLANTSSHARRERSQLRLSGFRREHARHDLLHDGHDGSAQGRLFLATVNWCFTRSPSWRRWRAPNRDSAFIAAMCTCRSRRCSTSTLGHALHRHACWA